MDKLQQLIEWIEGIPDKNNDLMKWLITVILYEARKIQAEGFSRPQEKPNWLNLYGNESAWTYGDSMAIKPVWTPTPWERIDVSNDGENWMPRKFLAMNEKYFSCRFTAGTRPHPWKYARPLTVGNCSEIPNSWIELPPEYKSWTVYEAKEVQLQALTESLREVIKVVNILNK